MTTDATGHPLLKSLVRIRRPRGGSAGTGFLIDKRRICTCAHVIADALGIDRAVRQAPPDLLSVEFPFLSAGPLGARVVNWQPSQGNDGRGDIAVLELCAPAPGASPARLLAPRRAAGRSIIAYGLPDGDLTGQWVQGQAGYPGAQGWIQLAMDAIKPGFSGAPVWEIQGGGVIGMIAAISQPHSTAPAPGWLIPLAQIVALEPALASSLDPPDDAITTTTIQRALVADGQFTPVEQLALSPQVTPYTAEFDFIGVRWSTLYAFTAALRQVGQNSLSDIEGYCEQYSTFNNALYWKPQGLDVSWPIWFVGFTLAGVLCLVFEQGGAAAFAEQLAQQQRPSPAFKHGLGQLLWWQHSATSLVWMLDIPEQRLYKNLGKLPDGSNMHARWTARELEQLEDVIMRQFT